MGIFSTLFLVGYYSIIGTISVVAIIGRWFIFQKNNKDGWRAIIPFYNWYTYGEIADDKKIGLTYTIIYGLYYVAALILSFTLGLLIGFDEAGAPDEVMGIVGIIFFITLLIFVALFVAYLVFKIILFNKFDKKLGLTSSWIIGWIFVPQIIEIILGFNNTLLKDRRIGKEE